MSREEANQKLEEIKRRKYSQQQNAEYSAISQSSNVLISHLETRLNEKDTQIGHLHEEIGRLKERIAQLEREKNISGVSFQSIPQRETVDSL